MSDPFALSFECQEAWERMTELAPGQRRCDRCSETVVDLSRLTRKQALAVVRGPNPPCVSYLKRGDAPVFARPSWGNGLLAAAAGLLAACATPSEEACELGPEPATEEPLLEEGLASTPLAVEAVGAPTPTAVAPQNVADTAREGDPNDVDGTRGGLGSTGQLRPPVSVTRTRGRTLHSTRMAGIPARSDRNVP